MDIVYHVKLRVVGYGDPPRCESGVFFVLAGQVAVGDFASYSMSTALYHIFGAFRPFQL